MGKAGRWSEKTIELIKCAGILLIPVLLYSIPEHLIFGNIHSLCLFKTFSGIECYGCGTTRAVFSVLHFRFSDAVHYNKGIVIVMPLLIYLWTKMLYVEIKRLRH